MKQPDIKIDSTIHSRRYENDSHLDFGEEPVATAPLENPKEVLGRIATQVSEVISGVRSVEQLAPVLNEHVYESLRIRASARARERLKSGKKPVIRPSRVIRVHYQMPVSGVIESVVVISNRDRSRAVAIRMEGIHNRWRATNIGFL